MHAGSGDPPFYKARRGACVSWPERICLVLQERFEKRFGFFPRKKLPRGVGFVRSCLVSNVCLGASKVKVCGFEIFLSFSFQKRISCEGEKKENACNNNELEV